MRSSKICRPTALSFLVFATVLLSAVGAGASECVDLFNSEFNHSGGVVKPTDDRTIGKFLNSVNHRAVALITHAPSSEFRDIVFGKVEKIRETPPLYAIKAKSNGRTFTHQFDMDGLQRENASLTLFLDEAAHWASQVGDLKPTLKYSTARFAKNPIPFRSRNHDRLQGVPDLIAKSGRMFSPEFLRDFFKGQPEVVVALIEKWYESASPKIVRMAERMRPEHITLLLDPGIASRIDIFSDFYSSYIKTYPGADVLTIRSAFSDRLGTATVYRGAMLSREIHSKDDELVREHVFLPGVLKSLSHRNGIHRASIQSFFDETVETRGGMTGTTGVFDAIATQGSNTWVTPFVSTSKYIPVAHMAAWDYIKRKFNYGHFYLFELRVPEIDLIYNSSEFGGFSDWYARNTFKTSNPDMSPFVMAMSDPNFEILATHLGPENISAYYRYDNKPPGFEIVPNSNR